MEAHYRTEAVRQGREKMQARATQRSFFNQEQQAQIVQAQIERFNRAELARRAALEEQARQAQLEWAKQAQPPLYAPEQAWLAPQPEYNPAHQPQAPFNLEPVWPAPQPELTLGQQAQLEQYSLEQQAQQALEWMGPEQPPYSEYPGQGGDFQQ
jgi:hypothetical protein